MNDSTHSPTEQPFPSAEARAEIQNPKRRYVKTPARLAAALANLAKARAAPKEKIYRRTEKRLAANRANLEKARQADQALSYPHSAKREAAARAALEAACEARQRRRAAGLDPNIHHGHTCRDPRQALRMLGRQREEYEAHRALWRQALPARDERERELVEGIAQAAWRRLQLYRSQAIEQALVFQARLQMGPEVIEQAMAERAKEIGEEAAAEERQQLAQAVMSLAVEGVSSFAPELEERLGQGERRLERLLRLYLREREEDQGFGFVARNRGPDRGLLRRGDAQAMGNAFARSRRVEAAEARGTGILPVGIPAQDAQATPGGQRWQWLGAEARHRAREQELTELMADAAADELHPFHFHGSLAELRLQLVTAKGEVFNLGEGEPKVTGRVQGFLPHLPEWVTGWWPQGEERERVKRLRMEWVQGGQTDALPVRGVGECRRLLRGVLGGEARGVAEEAWNRLGVYWERAKDEERKVQGILQAAAEVAAGWETASGAEGGEGDSSEPEGPRQPKEVTLDDSANEEGDAPKSVERRRAEAVMQVLTWRQDTRLRAEEAEARLREALYHLFKRRQEERPQDYGFAPSWWTDEEERKKTLEMLSIVYPEVGALLEPRGEGAGPP